MLTVLQVVAIEVINVAVLLVLCTYCLLSDDLSLYTFYGSSNFIPKPLLEIYSFDSVHHSINILTYLCCDVHANGLF